MRFASPLEWSVSARPKQGESTCGDRDVVVEDNGSTLLAVVDAIGHGVEAAASADVAEDAIRRNATEPLISIVKFCHGALRGQRGVVMSVARYERGPQLLTWLSVGNVEGVLLVPGARKARLIMRGGVVGSNLPELRAETLDIARGALLIFATDGIDPAFADTIEPDPRATSDIVDDLMRSRGRINDDALVLAARFAAEKAE